MAVGILQSIDKWQIWQIILVALMTKGSRLLYKVPSETDKRKLIRQGRQIFTEISSSCPVNMEECSNSLVVREIKIN